MSTLMRFNNDLMTWSRWGRKSQDEKVKAAAESVMSMCIHQGWSKVVSVPEEMSEYVVVLENAWVYRDPNKTT